MLQEKIKSHKYTLLGLKFNVGRKISKAVDDLRKNGIPTGIDCRAFVLNIHGCRILSSFRDRESVGFFFNIE